MNLVCLPQSSVTPRSQETLCYPVPTLRSSLSCQLPEFQKDLWLPLPFQHLSRRSTCALTHTLFFKTRWELLLFQEVVLELSSGCLACGLFGGDAWYTFYLQITTSPSRLQTPWEQRWYFIHLPSVGARGTLEPWIKPLKPSPDHSFPERLSRMESWFLRNFAVKVHITFLLWVMFPRWKQGRPSSHHCQQTEGSYSWINK